MPESGERGAALRVLFMGTPALAVPALDALIERFDVVAVATQPDRPRGRGKKVVPSSVKERALEAGIPVLQPPDLRDSEAIESLRATRPDVIAVVAYGLILPPEVLELPPLGCVNLHASLLPRHRGAAPIQAAILAGDEISGVTTMLMDEGLDTGPILLREEVPVAGDDTAGSLGRKLSETGARLLARTLGEIGAGRLEPTPQDESEATMTGLIRKEDGRLDWTRPAAELERRVRAMQPWPGAYCLHGDTRLRVWRATLGGDADGEPGVVVSVSGSVDVACGQGRLLRLLALQRPGGRKLDAADFLRGYDIEPGDRLDGP